MKRNKRYTITALCLSILWMEQPSSLAADEKALPEQTPTKNTQKTVSATVDDICSKGPSSLMRDLGPHKPIEAIVLGDTELYQMKNGQKKINTMCGKHPSIAVEDTRDLRNPIMSGMYTNFSKQDEIVGQANLTLRINADRSFEVLSQTIYVPGCSPYSGGAEVPPAARKFCEQINSAVATLALSDLTIGNPEVEYVVFEVVIGRDPQSFPRHATPFNGLFTVDENGNVKDHTPE